MINVIELAKECGAKTGLSIKGTIINFTESELTAFANAIVDKAAADLRPLADFEYLAEFDARIAELKLKG